MRCVATPLLVEVRHTRHSCGAEDKEKVPTANSKSRQTGFSAAYGSVDKRE
jgi:hypothetical protein